MAEEQDTSREQQPSAGPTRRKVLEEAAILSDAFDEDILSEIEQRLEQVEGELAERRGEDKVELDKEGLAIEEPPAPEQEPPPPTEVELSDEQQQPPKLPPELREPPTRRRGLVMGVIAGVVGVMVGVGLWIFWPSEQAPPKPKASVASYSGRVPNPELMLRVDLEPFMIPLLVSPEGGLLRVKISLVAVDPQARAAIAKRPVVVRDTIYHALANRPAAELKQAKMRGALSRELIQALNRRLGRKLVGKVYFTRFQIVG